MLNNRLQFPYSRVTHNIIGLIGTTLWILLSMHQETLIDISKGYVWNQLKKVLMAYQSNQKKKTKKKKKRNPDLEKNPKIIWVSNVDLR